MDGAWVYLVTGGCGFVGERIVELLSQQDYIKEVRVFDSVAREEVEKFSTGKKRASASIQGDIRDPGVLLAAMQGVHVVVHTAALVDYRGTVPFWELRQKSLGMGNAEQTRLAQMALSSVPLSLCLPQCSRGDEDTEYSGEVELPYGKTKAMAEKIVREANGKKREIPAVFLKWNVAWMHVLAARSLQLQPELLAGQVYYCYDDTPSRKGFLVRLQLLSSADPGVRLGSHIPYWKMWLLIQLHRLIRAILPPFWRPQPFLNVPLLNTIVTSFSFETDKASRHFGYKPLFSWEQSRLRTAQWLKAAAGSLAPPQLHGKNN
uniref:3-beta hydroxysteroid dehydrogenase/isomerase domain-containing protein n=1 Tax=Catharus ustulatus TaxID=91951 RepID=A0A8C3UET2_CATUS